MAQRRAMWLLAIVPLAIGVAFGCSTSASTDDPGVTGPDPDGGGADGGGGSETGSCTDRSAFDAARAALEGGAASAFIDCAKTTQIARTRNADGSVATDRLTYASGAYALWDYTKIPETFRFYPKADASVASHATDRTPAADDDAGDNGGMVVSTDDTDGDGIPDERTTSTLDVAGMTVTITIEKDSAQNGSWEQVSSTTADVNQPKVSVDPSGDPMCPPDFAKQLDDAISDVYAEQTCLRNVAPDMSAQLTEVLLGEDVVIECAPAPPTAPGADPPCANTNASSWFTRLFGAKSTISVYPVGFDTAKCGTLGALELHELLHVAVGEHRFGDGSQDPGDRIWNCERTCGDMAIGMDYSTSQTCAACGGRKNDPNDPACKGYDFVACDGGAPTYCRCNGQYYPSDLYCEGMCPTGLSCFAFQCAPATGPCP